mgnify:CR=1 FL=1
MNLEEKKLSSNKEGMKIKNLKIFSRVTSVVLGGAIGISVGVTANMLSNKIYNKPEENKIVSYEENDEFIAPEGFTINGDIATKTVKSEDFFALEGFTINGNIATKIVEYENYILKTEIMPATKREVYLNGEKVTNYIAPAGWTVNGKNCYKTTIINKVVEKDDAKVMILK